MFNLVVDVDVDVFHSLTKCRVSGLVFCFSFCLKVLWDAVFGEYPSE